MADSEKINDSGASSAVPDISFGSGTSQDKEHTAADTSAAAAKTAPTRPEGSEGRQMKPPPPRKTPSGERRTDNSGNKQGRPPKAAGSPKKTAPKGKAALGKGSPSAKNGERPVKKGKRPSSANAEGAKLRKTAGKRPVGADARVRKKNTAGQRPVTKQDPDGTPVKKKVKFTRKQAMQVTGLILVLFLIFGLAVFLIFSHYFGLLGKITDDVQNSSPKLYSDVDFSQADTFEKSVEDEKLQELTNKAEKITSREVMNILLVGEDLRDTAEKDAGNTDVMMLISVNTKDNTITLTSIMRDLYVSFGNDELGWYSDRINAAYWYGGMKLTKNTIEDYLNVKIDRYVLVNFKVFIDIVDALGGIDMHVTDLEANGDPNEDPNGDNTRGMQNPLDEQNKYLGNKKKTDYIKKGGDLHLNGNQALAYARLRHVGNADYERTERQRKVIKEMIKESRHMSLVEMDKLANKVFPQVKTDVTMGEPAGLLLEMLNYRNYKLQEFRVPADETFTNEFIDGKAVLLADFSMNQEMFREKAYGTVEIEESSSKSQME